MWPGAGSRVLQARVLSGRAACERQAMVAGRAGHRRGGFHGIGTTEPGGSVTSSPEHREIASGADAGTRFADNVGIDEQRNLRPIEVRERRERGTEC